MNLYASFLKRSFTEFTRISTHTIKSDYCIHCTPPSSPSILDICSITSRHDLHKLIISSLDFSHDNYSKPILQKLLNGSDGVSPLIIIIIINMCAGTCIIIKLRYHSTNNNLYEHP